MIHALKKDKEKKEKPQKKKVIKEKNRKIKDKAEKPQAPEIEGQVENKEAAPKKKKGKGSSLILAVVFIAGLGLLLYPSVSDWWNSFHQSRAISNYAERVSAIDEDEYEKILSSADAFNDRILKRKNQYVMSDSEMKDYKSQLDIDGSGIMGYIEISKINVSLPIYHGTDDAVLQIAIGHLDWTSLPIGGKSTHCVLSGHRGLPSAKLFTNLDKLEVGDTFVMRVLDEMFTYEVDQILIVLPQDTEALRMVKGMDYCTLVTCTPYGINSHRLLVRGHRVENAETVKEIKVTSDATRIEPLIIAPIIAAPILLLLLIVVAGTDKKRSRSKKAQSNAAEMLEKLNEYEKNKKEKDKKDKDK